MLHAARALGKPIHWVSTRSEAFVTDNQGRDSFWTVELALNKRGRFLGLARRMVSAMLGAYFTGVAHFVFTTHVSGCLPTVYDIPLAQVNSRCVFTNTLPTGPYRGAGRPEASYLLERVIDAAADLTGIDAAELRRRNLIAPDKIPYTTAFGNTYDSGDFPAVFERALSSPTTTASPRAERRRRKPASCAASASAAIWRSPARSRKKPRASLSRRRQGRMSALAPARAGRGIRPCSARWRRGGSASRRRRSRHAPAIPRATCRALAPSPRARP